MTEHDSTTLRDVLYDLTRVMHVLNTVIVTDDISNTRYAALSAVEQLAIAFEVLMLCYRIHTHNANTFRLVAEHEIISAHRVMQNARRSTIASCSDDSSVVDLMTSLSSFAALCASKYDLQAFALEARAITFDVSTN